MGTRSSGPDHAMHAGDEPRDDYLSDDAGPAQEFVFEDGSRAPNPDETSGYEVIREEEEQDYDEDGCVDSVTYFAVVRKIPLAAQPYVALVQPVRRMGTRSRSRRRIRRSRSKARSPGRPRQAAAAGGGHEVEPARPGGH